MGALDLSLYLVTGRELLPPGKDYLSSLEDSLKGGVTIVQIREKHATTSEFIDIASKSKEICDRYDVPILINDRLDVALAVDAAGVHVGQKDMKAALARQILPPGKIIGVSCNSVEDATQAVKDKADYVGIGPVWATPTKTDTEPSLGVRGISPVLEVLTGSSVQAVAIGGIKSANLLRLLHGSTSLNNTTLDGVAVVSEIMASPEPQKAAEKLSGIVKAFKQLVKQEDLHSHKNQSVESILQNVKPLLENIRAMNPLIHQITNTVVVTQSANVTLALGASPIMATTPEEMEDLSKIPGALLINIGTLQTDGRLGMRQAGYYANIAQKPIVLDPVGVGATQFRKDMVNEFLDLWQASVIKGNAGELAAIAGSTEVESKGVDSLGPGFKDPVAFVRRLARREKSIVVLTGPTDYIASPSGVVVGLQNGHPILGQITGSGCMVGSSIASYCAVASALSFKSGDTSTGRLVNGDMFLGAIAGVLATTVAAEIVVEKYQSGPGFFLSHLVDELWKLDSSIVTSRAKINVYSDI